MYLENKNILIISTDRWRKLRVSKHHYALELVRNNNTVFFLNPVESGTPFFDINPVDDNNNLYSVDFNNTIRGVRYLPSALIKIIEYFQIKLFLALLKRKIDVVWCFSDFSFKSLDLFGSDLVVFHPVDMMMSGGIPQAQNADLILSVAENIVERYKNLGKSVYIINHGLSSPFEEEAIKNLESSHDIKTNHHQGLRIGYVGNLLRNEIDHEVFLRIIEENSNIEFDIWGPYDYKSIEADYSIPGEVANFIKNLASKKNVHLHGLCEPELLARQLQKMDAFLICYDANKEINKCSNNHKVIEYLSTGKTVITNYIESYKDKENLIVMPGVHDNNQLPFLFKEVVNNITEYNSPVLAKKRMEYALQNTYAKHLKTIDSLIKKTIGL